MKKSLLKLSLGIVAIAFGLSSIAQTYTFTNCTATGRLGPTQGQVNTAYTSTNLQGNVTINTQGIQEWTVPTSGNYTIEVFGAEGATSLTDPGKGAHMVGEFSFTAGEVLLIAVGQQGVSVTNGGAGGAGGSFVVKKTGNVAQIVAGGGMGGNNHTATGYSVSEGGSITNTGSIGGAQGYNVVIGGGGGFTTDGGGTNGGSSFLNGCMGGTGSPGAGEGGFGGGGGKGTSTLNGGCGGGGYSGGAGNNNTSLYSGGGSYNIGTNQVNLADTNSGNGMVIIASTCNGGPGAAIAVFTQDSVCLNDAAVALPAGTPAGGTFYGNGVSGSTFIPSIAGVGTHYVVYSYTDSCSAITLDSTMIVVNAGPTILLNSFANDTVCVQDQPQSLPAGNPSGGVYTGNGVSGGSFIPSVAGVGTHYVVYTASGANSCSSSDSTMIVVEACVGINENAGLNEVSVYPNPTNGLFTIELGVHDGTVNYSISTVEGRIVSSERGIISNTIVLDISNESKGIYLLRVEDVNSTKIYKVIKE